MKQTLSLFQCLTSHNPSQKVIYIYFQLRLMVVVICVRIGIIWFEQARSSSLWDPYRILRLSVFVFKHSNGISLWLFFGFMPAKSSLTPKPLPPFLNASSSPLSLTNLSLSLSLFVCVCSYVWRRSRMPWKFLLGKPIMGFY